MSAFFGVYLILDIQVLILQALHIISPNHILSQTTYLLSS